MPATLALCISRELRLEEEELEEEELAEAGFAVTTPDASATELLEVVAGFVPVLPPGSRSKRGPSIPTENPISTSRAALHAGCGEIQLAGSSAPIVRRSQLFSSC